MSKEKQKIKGIDELVRDITKVGSISKSEARRRIENIIEQILSELEIKKEHFLSFNSHICFWKIGYNQAVKEINKEINQIKKKYLDKN